MLFVCHTSNVVALENMTTEGEGSSQSNPTPLSLVA